MSTTTENGWTKQTPPVNGLYLWRADEGDIEPEIHEIAEGLVYQIESRRSEPVANYGGEWLGPFTASDLEQLAALRSAAVQLVIPYEALLVDTESRRWIAPEIWRAIEDGVAALREALKPELAQGEKS